MRSTLRSGLRPDAIGTAPWLMTGAIALVGTLALVLGWLIHARVIAANLPLIWDEGAHSLFALAIAEDMRRGDLIAFAYDTYRQVYWPPLHSWVVGGAFLAFGERIAIARDVSLLAYVLLPITLLGAARVMHPPNEHTRGWLAATAAGVLAVALPAFVPFAAIAFLDLPALLALCATILVAFFATRSPDRPRRRVLVALGILTTFFVKTNYGLLLMFVFAVDTAIEARWSPRRWVSQGNVHALGVVVLVLAVWFAYPPKIGVTVRAMANTPAGADPWTLQGLMFYPRTLLTFAGSIPMLCLLVGGSAMTWRDRRQPNVRLLLILAITQFILGELHHTKEDRHLLPIVPPLVLLTAASIARVVADARRAARSAHARWRMALGIVVAGVVVAQIGMLIRQPFPDPWQDGGRRPLGRDQLALAGAVDSALAGGRRVLVVGTFDLQPGPPITDWHLIVDRRVLPVQSSGAVGGFDRARDASRAIRRSRLPVWLSTRLLRVLDRSDGPSLRTMYAGLPERLAPGAFARSVAETISGGRVDEVIVATLASSEAKYPISYLHPALASPSLALVSSRVVGDGPGVRLDEYQVRRGEGAR